MIHATSLWLRRSTSAFLFPALLLVAVAAPFSRSGWQYEWLWAESSVAGGTVLLGGLMAALVAHDRANKLRGIGDCESRSVRGMQSALSMPFASLLLGIGAWLVAAGVVLSRVAMNDVGGAPALWPAAEASSVLFAHTSVGFLVGSWWRTKAAGAIGAVASYGIGTIALQFGLAGVLLQAGGATGSLVGLQRSEQFTWALVLVNVTFGLLCLSLSFARPSRAHLEVRRSMVAATTMAVFVAAVAYFHHVDSKVLPYEPRIEPTVCVGDGPRFCGPESAKPLLVRGERSLQKAADALRESGLQLSSQYTMPRGMARLPWGSGVLSISPELLDEEGLGLSDLILTFQTPVDCVEYHADRPTRILVHQEVVQRWMVRVLEGERVAVSPDVEEAYQHLTQCDPFEGPIA